MEPNKEADYEFLSKHFKNVKKCLKCGTLYGSDLKKDNNYCPNCCKEVWREGR